jgi:hypothetical protein
MVDSNGFMVYRATSTPASASAACTAGTWTNDVNYIYICIGTNTWKRAGLTSF